MIDLVIVIGYLCGVVAVGLYVSRRIKSIEEYAVVTRSYGSLVIFATMSASFIGGGFSIGIPLVLIFGIVEAGGVEAVVEAVPDRHLSLPGADYTWIGVIALFLTFLMGETLVPPYLQRLLIAKDANHAARGALFAGLFSIPFFSVSGLIGLVALAFEPTMASNLALPQLVVTVLPPVVKGLVIAGILAVVMSSGDSFLNAAAIAFVNDIVRPLGGERLSARIHLGLARLVTFAIGILSVILALTIESLLDILIFAYTYWAPVIVVPLVATILGHPRGTRNFIAGAIGGFVTALIWNEVFDKPLLIEGFVIGAAINLSLFMLVPTSRPRSAAET